MLLILKRSILLLFPISLLTVNLAATNGDIIFKEAEELRKPQFIDYGYDDYIERSNQALRLYEEIHENKSLSSDIRARAAINMANLYALNVTILAEEKAAGQALTLYQEVINNNTVNPDIRGWARRMLANLYDRYIFDMRPSEAEKKRLDLLNSVVDDKQVKPETKARAIMQLIKHERVYPGSKDYERRKHKVLAYLDKLRKIEGIGAKSLAYAAQAEVELYLGEFWAQNKKQNLDKGLDIINITLQNKDLKKEALKLWLNLFDRKMDLIAAKNSGLENQELENFKTKIALYQDLLKDPDIPALEKGKIHERLVDEYSYNSLIVAEPEKATIKKGEISELKKLIKNKEYHSSTLYHGYDSLINALLKRDKKETKEIQELIHEALKNRTFTDRMKSQLQSNLALYQIYMIESGEIKPENPLKTFNELYNKALQPEHLSTKDRFSYMNRFLSILSSQEGIDLHRRERDEKYIEIAEKIIKHPEFQSLDKWQQDSILQDYNRIKK